MPARALGNSISVPSQLTVLVGGGGCVEGGHLREGPCGRLDEWQRKKGADPLTETESQVEKRVEAQVTSGDSAADRRGDADGVGRIGTMEAEGLAHNPDLALVGDVVDPGTAVTLAASAPMSAAEAVVLAMPMSPVRRQRFPATSRSRATSMPTSTADTASSRVIAGPVVMSPVACRTVIPPAQTALFLCWPGFLRTGFGVFRLGSSPCPAGTVSPWTADPKGARCTATP